MKADLDPTSHDTDPLPVRLLVLPQFAAGAPTRLRRRGRAESFLFTAYHAFNYSLLADTGFDTMCRLMDALECFDLRYSDLEQGVAALDRLHDDFCQ
jgi:hypothetical protein